MINGANIRLWCFAKEEGDFVTQTSLCSRYGWHTIRDNSTEMGYEWSNGGYTIEDEVRQITRLTNYGFNVLLTISDCAPWLDRCVSSAQYSALMNRYGGDKLNVRRAINSIGIATAMPAVVSKILERSSLLLSRLGSVPRFSVEMDNGGEGVQWRGGPWDVLSDGFMRDMRALGFGFPHPWFPLWWRQSIVRSNIESLRMQLRNVWGSRLLGPAMHLYDWGWSVHQLGETSNVVTEYGASINEGLDRAGRLVSVRQIAPSSRTMMLLHSPLDSRFMETYFDGQTMKLWKAPDYQQLLAARGVGPVEYDGLIALEPDALAQIASFAT